MTGPYIHRDENASQTNGAKNLDQKNGILVIVASCIYNRESHGLTSLDFIRQMKNILLPTGPVQPTGKVEPLHGVIYMMYAKLEEIAKLLSN